MLPRELIGTAQIPGGEELKLVKHGRDFIIMLGRNELMSSRMSGSEEALANMTCERLKSREAPHFLIGGYGMGFTLRAALKQLGPKAKITVAELAPEIIDWARGPMAELHAGCLDDPRVKLVIDDVNGPDGLVRDDNDKIYSRSGLERAKAALRHGGVLAVWSAAPDDRFARRLENTGFKVDEVTVRARSNGKGPKHVIWFAKR